MNSLDGFEIDKVYGYQIDGLTVETGDLICTTDGNPSVLIGQFWWFVGKLIPGEVDHIVVYVGPKGRCVEAGAKGKVITFSVHDHHWDAASMFAQRNMTDRLYGIAYPLAERGLSEKDVNRIRVDVAQYCLRQAKEGKPYNLNFQDCDTEEAFYCSQLAYKAYIRPGINLNTEKGIPNIPFSKNIVFPSEVWHACNKRVRV
jgi:hypothetical protein